MNKTKKKTQRKPHSYKQAFKPNVCNPSVNKSAKRTSKRTNINISKHIPGSCLPPKMLNKVKTIYNMRHPDDKIQYTNHKNIHRSLKRKLKDVCHSERCWIESIVPDSKNTLNKYFAPKQPTSWKKNKNEWLNSLDISRVMKQYETAYPEFKFLGPAPIDFEFMDGNDTCIFPDICNLNLSQERQNGKTKIGLIFNTDPHDKPGAHWICVFIDLDKNKYFFFDSTGDKIPNELQSFYNKLKKNYKKLKFISNEGFEHQYGETECGVYCLYTIINLLERSKKMEDFMKQRISDKYIESFRKQYFDTG